MNVLLLPPQTECLEDWFSYDITYCLGKFFSMTISKFHLFFKA
jgi:hypothetical protein